MKSGADMNSVLTYRLLLQSFVDPRNVRGCAIYPELLRLCDLHVVRSLIINDYPGNVVLLSVLDDITSQV